MATEERKEVFENLEHLKLKPGEVLRTSYFNAGGKEPMFVITEKADGTFTLYDVDGKGLKKIQSAASVQSLDAYVAPKLK